MRGNKIQEITVEQYLKQVTILKLSLMPSFETGVLVSLPYLRVFSVPRSQQLNRIPRDFSILNPCVFLQREDFVLHCTCSYLWMVDWVSTKSFKICSSNPFRCLNGSKEESLLTYLPMLVCSETQQIYIPMSISASLYN
jgi:hypothetical protein